MSKIIPWEKLCSLINTVIPTCHVGRKLRIYCLQQRYNLSDSTAEEAIYDRISFQNFLNLDIFSGNIPYETTILNFRHLLEKYNMQEAIFKTINLHLEEKNLLMKQGTIVDATIMV